MPTACPSDTAPGSPGFTPARAAAASDKKEFVAPVSNMTRIFVPALKQGGGLLRAVERRP